MKETGEITQCRIHSDGVSNWTLQRAKQVLVDRCKELTPDENMGHRADQERAGNVQKIRSAYMG